MQGPVKWRWNLLWFRLNRTTTMRLYWHLHVCSDLNIIAIYSYQCMYATATKVTWKSGKSIYFWQWTGLFKGNLWHPHLWLWCHRLPLIQAWREWLTTPLSLPLPVVVWAEGPVFLVTISSYIVGCNIGFTVANQHHFVWVLWKQILELDKHQGKT